MTPFRLAVSPVRAAAVLLALFTLAGCVTPRGGGSGGGDPHYKVGSPYKVNGKWYRPSEDPNYEAVGVASWYGSDFHGRMTANGEIFDMNRLSAAHTTLPLPSLVEVTNLKNGKKIIVRVNDRGPFAGNRVIDLSRQAARELGFEREGLARVRVRYMGRAPLMAKAPRQATQIVRAEPVEVSKPVIAAAAPPPHGAEKPVEQPVELKTDRQTSSILTAMENAPALTSGAESFAIAQAEKPAPAREPIPATQFSPNPSGVAGVTAASSPASGLNTLYLVRVAALTQLDFIENLKAELEPIGPLRLSRVETDAGAVLYRVNMGPFASLDVAHQRLEAVRNAGYADAGLVTLTP